ncbi:MerC family mercury resistance protein [Alienimonas californiensis]|uniref:Outer membrane biogenesis protein BamB n=1 Tax=Alienimonas californiensis TaxID=2527989 RepID=A0A517P6Q7_9PLAN|nr:MerC family mercury resistance protein [Alienimonas californiensis]QDT15032.1 outer membrane biogenesis protein BamB [Alienimonas californiensis]
MSLAAAPNLADPCEEACCRHAPTDLFGIVCSVGCGIHCAAMPLLIAAAPAVGGSWLGGEAAHLVLLPLCAGAAFWSMRSGVRRHGRRSVPWIAAAGVSLLAAGVAVPSLLNDGSAGEAAGGGAGACSAACCQSTAIASPEDGPAAAVVRFAVPFLTPLGGGLLVLAHLVNLFAAPARRRPVHIPEPQTTMPALARSGAVLVLACCGTTAHAADGSWSDFRGGGASVADAADLPLNWSPEDGVAWSVELPGVGQSSPVVFGDRAYVTFVEGPNKEAVGVAALSVATGETLWTQRFDAARTSPNDFMHGRAAPTPAADGAGVVAFFASGDLIALTPDGTKRWRRNLWEEFGPFENNHDLGTSPAQDAERLLLQLDHGGPSLLLAVSKADGQTAWTAEREPRTSFTSPVVAEIAGTAQVVCSSNGSVDGYDAATGAKLWSLDGLTGNTIPSPVVVGNRVYVGAKPGRGNTDVAAAQESNCCVEVSRTPAGDWTAELLWRANRTLSHYSSPLVHRGRCYYLNNVGVLACFDAETGDLLHRGRLGFESWATPIGAGDRVYCFGRGGECAVLAAADDFELLAENRLWSPEASGETAAEAPPQPPADGAGADDESDGRPGAGGYDGPFVYGAAPVAGGFLLRTETRLYRVGAATPTP